MLEELFTKLSCKTSEYAGSRWSFLVAVLVIVLWLITGPLFGFTNTWQLIINTGTTVITFLMVFLIQGSQNRDSLEVHLKLDALIEAAENADNNYLSLDKASVKELQEQTDKIKERATTQQPNVL